MAEYEEGRCDTCPFHGINTYKIETHEKGLIALNTCFKDVKKDIANLEKGQALMQQKFDNIRYPIWIIFAAVLVEVAKALVTFAPTAKAAGTVFGVNQ